MLLKLVKSYLSPTNLHIIIIGNNVDVKVEPNKIKFLQTNIEEKYNINIVYVPNEKICFDKYIFLLAHIVPCAKNIDNTGAKKAPK